MIRHFKNTVKHGVWGGTRRERISILEGDIAGFLLGESENPTQPSFLCESLSKNSWPQNPVIHNVMDVGWLVRSDPRHDRAFWLESSATGALAEVFHP